MRVVGYVREAPGPQEGETAYAQAERIRRWIADAGHQLVAVCQDIRTPGRELGREGFRALLGIVSAGQVDAVILPELDSLSPDLVTQEIMLWDLRRRDVRVVTTLEEEIGFLEDPPADNSRLLLRDVLAKIGDYLEGIEGVDSAPPPTPALVRVDETMDVIVELIPPSTQPDGLPAPGGQARPANQG